MNIVSLDIHDLKIITPKRFADERGFFCETYNAQAFRAAGINCDFVQDNHSYSAQKWTLRGLHYQAPPFAQAKLVRVARGAVIDIAVDIRKSSATFGKWIKAELSAENGAQLLVPAGFLHGFLTLQPDTEVIYKVDAHYDKNSDGCVVWNDPDLKIDWGVAASDVTLSDKDANGLPWKAFDTPF